jgi:hypothetical protein
MEFMDHYMGPLEQVPGIYFLDLIQHFFQVEIKLQQFFDFFLPFSRVEIAAHQAGRKVAVQAPGKVLALVRNSSRCLCCAS